MIRIVHLVVVCLFVAAAVHVYRIKFDSTVQAERVARLRAEIKRERNEIARLRSEWARLDTPARIQQLANRHLPIKPVDVLQFDQLDKLPERPPQLVPMDASDPIAMIIENVDGEPSTGSVEGETR
jgi:cell division protein FtsL